MQRAKKDVKIKSHHENVMLSFDFYNPLVSVKYAFIMERSFSFSALTTSENSETMVSCSLPYLVSHPDYQRNLSELLTSCAYAKGSQLRVWVFVAVVVISVIGFVFP